MPVRKQQSPGKFGTGGIQGSEEHHLKTGEWPKEANSIELIKTSYAEGDLSYIQGCFSTTCQNILRPGGGLGGLMLLVIITPLI
jgi:hypothetical protein